MFRTTSKRMIALLVGAALVVTPGAALAASGGDQYCDPFGGCGVSGGGGSGGGKPRGKHKPSGSSDQTQSAQGTRDLEWIANSIQDSALAAKAKAAAASGPGSAAAIEWSKAYRLSKAGDVLDAAGLSALRLALPNS